MATAARTLLARYSTVLKAAPLRTNLATAVPLMVVGDLCAQQLERGVDKDKTAPNVTKCRVL